MNNDDDDLSRSLIGHIRVLGGRGKFIRILSSFISSQIQEGHL